MLILVNDSEYFFEMNHNSIGLNELIGMLLNHVIRCVLLKILIAYLNLLLRLDDNFLVDEMIVLNVLGYLYFPLIMLKLY